MACIAYEPGDFFREHECLLLLLSCLMRTELFGVFGVCTYNQWCLCPSWSLFLKDPKTQIQLHTHCHVVHHFHNLHQSKSEVALQGSRAVTSALSLLLNVWVSSVLPWLPTSEGDIHSAAAGLVGHYCKISFSTTLLTMLGIH